jgi:hypothetical protein
MTFKKLRITGPQATPYQLGQPMHVYDGNILLAVLDPVPVRNAGTEIHIEAFRPTRVVREERRHVGRLIFLEICAFIAEHFHQIQAISFAFSRQIDTLGGGAQQAVARTQVMERIGAVNVQMAPRADIKPGHFVVSGVWAYSGRNLAALHAVLECERALYRAQPIQAGAKDRPGGLRAVLRRLMSRRRRGGKGA